MKRWTLRILGLVALLALVGGDAALPGTYLSRRDTFRLHLPLREFFVREVQAGRFPTWNELDGLGASVPGTAVTAATHPLQLLLALLTPGTALKWQILLCLMLAGLGAALLARRLGGPEATWWLAGIAYGGSGYLVSSTDNFTYLHGAALLPWVLLCAEKLAEQPSLPAAVGLGAVLSLGLHGGDVQGALLACLLSALWAVALSQHRQRAAVHVLLAAVVMLALSAPLLPAIAATALDSGRAAGLAAEEVLRWSLSPIRLLELPLGPLVPVELLDFHGPVLAQPLGGHTGALWVASEFVGVTVLVLAPLGLARGPLASARRYAVLATVGLVLSLGSWGGLYVLLMKVVPGWSAFRYPEKMMPLAVLGLALLAARGAGLAAGRGHRWSAFVAGVLLLPFTVAIDADVVTWLFSRLDASGALLSPDVAERIGDGLRASASAGLVVAVVLGLISWRRPEALGWVAVGALALQAAWCAHGLMETRSTDDLALRPSLLDAVFEAGGARTRLAAWPERYSYRGERFSATAAARRGDFEAISPDHNMRFGVGNIYAYLPGASGAIDRACSVRPQCTSACARRLGAGLCIVSPPIVDALVQRGAVVLARMEQPQLVLLRDPLARPWASVPGVRRLLQPEQLREAFMREESALPALLIDAEREYEAAPHAVMSWQRPRPDLAEIEVTLEQENLLVVAEQCARGWTATIDGKAAPTVRVDGGLCGVKVAAGTHAVQLRYVPPGWPWVWGIFVLGALGCGAVGWQARRRR